jgi:hypothetical protein
MQFFTCHSGKGVDHLAEELDLQIAKRPKQKYVHLLI